MASLRHALAAADSDSDDEETRRVEFLRRHRAMLEQKRRLETERRVSELESDKASIAKRQDELKAVKAAGGARRGSLGTSTSLPSLPGTKSQADHDVPLGMYAKPDEMSLETLRVVAEKQSLRDMAPLNTRGKYHARFMKDAYPIAGTQLRLEKERELILTAKKRLLLAKAVDPSPSVVTHSSPGGSGSSLGFGQLAYRKLDFYVDKFSAVLQEEMTDVDVAVEQRRVRLAGVEHRDGLEQFWKLMHSERYHETLSWLKTHRFRDVNLPVLLKSNSQQGKEGTLIVEVNKDVGLTPLMAACHLHDVALVCALLDQGAAVYITTANGDTAMHYLFHEWHEQQLTTLRRTTDVFVRADRTLRILQMLVRQQGADVNTQNAFGETVLQYCARLRLVSCVELLLSHGGDVRAPDRSGRSALSYARANNHGDLLRLLETYSVVECATAKERARGQIEAKLKQGRGSLTADWSASPERLLARLAVEDRRAGHLRNQFVDRHGNVIVCDDSSEVE